MPGTKSQDRAGCFLPGFPYICIMLSILIPTYNFNCTALVTELRRQADVCNAQIEIIVMDDASPDMEIRSTNKTIDKMPGCRLIQLPENIGIARIRNRLADESIYEHLLFLDADVFPVHDNFIASYLAHRNAADVVCGGLCFRPEPPSPECTLRYKYGSRVEAQSVAERMKSPYGEFRTLNFLVSREAFMKTRFDESFSRYGHEDTLFGKELQANGCTIAHIDNPIYHDVPDTNEVFLDKTKRGIDNLREHREVLDSHVRLLSFYNRLQQLHLTRTVAYGFRLSDSLLRQNLTGSHPSLILFNIYKVGYLCHIMTSKHD